MAAAGEQERTRPMMLTTWCTARPFAPSRRSVPVGELVPCSGSNSIELMIAVAVVGVLSSVAYPSFEAPIQRTRRVDALVSMMEIQAAQERLRSRATRYGSLAEIGAPSVSASRHYTLQMTAFNAEGYEVLATATGAQARDTGCRHMRLTASGFNVVYASGVDALVANADAANRKCWSL